MKIDQEDGEIQSALFEKIDGQNNDKLVTLKSSARLNIQQLREEHTAVQECSHTKLSGGNPSTLIPIIVTNYSPTRAPSVLKCTFQTQKPRSVFSLKPRKVQQLLHVKIILHTLYTNTKNKHKYLLPKIPVSHVNIPSITTQT